MHVFPNLVTYFNVLYNYVCCILLLLYVHILQLWDYYWSALMENSGVSILLAERGKGTHR